jgi:hypothetical protein
MPFYYSNIKKNYQVKRRKRKKRRRRGNTKRKAKIAAAVSPNLRTRRRIKRG